MIAATSAVFPRELPRRTLAEMGDFVSGWIDSNPVLNISRASRVHQLSQFVTMLQGSLIAHDDPSFPYALESMKDLNEYQFIIAVLGERLLQEPFLSRLRRSAKDPPLSAEGGADSQGRDAQFELFIGAVGCRAGFAMEEMGRGLPDWKANLPTTRYSIECKRIKSLDALERHIRKASGQIRESEIGGVIVVDFGRMDSLTPLWLQGHYSDNAIKDAQRKRANAFLGDYLPRIRWWIGDAPVGSLVLHDYAVMPGRTNPQNRADNGGLIGFWDTVQFFPPETDQRRRFEEFSALFGMALPNG